MESQSYAQKIKKLALELVYVNKASHIGGSFSVADILAVLFTDILNFRASDPSFSERDRVFFSKGHCCSIYYSCLLQSGFIGRSEFDSYSTNGSHLTAHVSHKVNGVELSTGSLGHALSVACGVALALKRRASSARVFCILSDGELNEGSNWEALMFASHHKLNNLCVILDCNGIQSLGFTRDVLNLEPLEDKMSSFGLEVTRISGHDHAALERELSRKGSQPSFIIANTVKGKGVSFMENNNNWHYKSPSREQYDSALLELEDEYK